LFIYLHFRMQKSVNSSCLYNAKLSSKIPPSYKHILLQLTTITLPPGCLALPQPMLLTLLSLI
jgi:hypothetical protein